MKIFHIFSTFPNSYQPYNVELINRLRLSGLDSLVGTFERPDRAKKEEKVSLNPGVLTKFIRVISNIIQVFNFAQECKISIFQSARVLSNYIPLLNLEPDIIHFHHIQNINKKMLSFLSAYNLRWIVSIRGYDVVIAPLNSNRMQENIIKILDKSYAIHSISGYLANAIAKLGVRNENIHIIPRTIKTKKFELNTKFPNAEYHITTIGRLNWIKGHEFVLLALSFIGDDISLRYNICGDGSELEIARIKYWINLLGLEDKVVLHGYLNEDRLTGVLQDTHIYIQPSLSEGMCNSLHQAMSLNIPCIASNVGAIPEVITHPTNGILTEPGNARSIADAIRMLITNNTLRETVMANSMKHISMTPELEIESYRTMYINSVNNNVLQL